MAVYPTMPGQDRFALRSAIGMGKVRSVGSVCEAGHHQWGDPTKVSPVVATISITIGSTDRNGASCSEVFSLSPPERQSVAPGAFGLY
jgi:hypothetical protein